MSWFGWLTKGRMDVSLLDALTFCFELILVVVVYVTIATYVEFFREWRNDHKKRQGGL